MYKAKIRFNFLSPWHMGSGFGEGAHLDAIPVKTASGLPYIPGRSVKGLFREAVMLAEECGQLPDGTTVRLFGTRNEELSRYETESGQLRFTNATMDPAMEEWASDPENKSIKQKAVKELFMPLASTKIEGNGLACDKSLRKIEVTLPVELEAEVEILSDPSSVSHLQTAARLIRQAGSDRHRGLGRVNVTVTEVK